MRKAAPLDKKRERNAAHALLNEWLQADSTNNDCTGGRIWEKMETPRSRRHPSVPLKEPIYTVWARECEVAFMLIERGLALRADFARDLLGLEAPLLPTAAVAVQLKQSLDCRWEHDVRSSKSADLISNAAAET